MPTIIAGTAGPSIVGDGAQPALRMGKTGEAIVTELHGKYFEQSYRGALFVATQPAAVLLSTSGVAAASFVIANPVGSGKIVSLDRFAMVLATFPTTPVAGAYVLAINNNPLAAVVTGTPVVPTPGMIGSAAQSVAKVFSSATLPAVPTIHRVVATKGLGASTTLAFFGPLLIEFDGTCLLLPGTSLALQQVVADATNATAIATMVWEELPL